MIKKLNKIKFIKRKIKRRKIREKKKLTNRQRIIYKICIIFFLLLVNFIAFTQILNIPIILKKNKGRFFLCTTYNNEAEILFIHLWRLYYYVDRFIIIVSNITYSGAPKNITFKEFEKNIRRYMNKVDIVNFNNICNIKEYPTSDSNWCYEQSQRDYAKTFIEEKYNLTEKDILIVVDLDEILTREGIRYIKKNPPNTFYFIYGAMYFPYYYHKVENWNRSFVIRYNKKMKTLSQYRTSEITTNNTLTFEFNKSKVLLTHCSYCFKDIEEYNNKLKSFAHQEFNKPPYTTNNWIFKSHYCRKKINSPEGYDEPYEGWKHLIPNDKRLKFLIDRSFMYPLNKTTYTEKDLETMCNKTYNRTPFELSAKYNPSI